MGIEEKAYLKASKGRPTKLNDSTQEIIVNALRRGNYVETAAALAGIQKTTIYDWLKRGSRERDRRENGGKFITKETKYVNFYNAVMEAEAYAEDFDVRNVVNAGKTQWQASAWRLERKHQDRWGKRSEVKAEVTGKDGGAIEIESARSKLLEKLLKGGE